MINPTMMYSMRPYQALPNMAMQYAFELGNELRVDKDMVACMLLSTVTAAGFDSINCELSSSYNVPGLLWMLVGAPSGAGKTPTCSRIQGVFEKLITSKICLSLEARQEIEAARNVLAKRIRRLSNMAAKCSHEQREPIMENLIFATKEMTDLRVPLSPVVDIISPYAFVDEISKRDGVMAAFGAEGSILSSFNTVAAEQLHPMLKSWCLEKISNITKKRGTISVDEPRLHIATAWQPCEARKLLCDQRYSQIGMGARFLYFEVQSNASRQGGGGLLSDKMSHWWEEVLARQVEYYLESKVNSHEPLRLSQEAKTYFDQCCDNWRFRIDLNKESRTFLSKSESHAVRLAIALHCLEENIFTNKIISGYVMQRACSLADFFLEEQSRVLLRNKDAKIRKEAVEVCKIFSRGQVEQADFRVSYATGYFASLLGESQKVVYRVMNWLRDRNFVCPVPIHLPNQKVLHGWQSLQYLNWVMDEDSLP